MEEESNITTPAEETSEPATEKSNAFNISLYVVGFALLLTYWGDLDGLSNHHSATVWKVVLGNLVVWFVNYSIAGHLMELFKSPETGNATSLFKFNLYATIAFGILMVIDAFGIDEESVLGLITSIAMLVGLPLYSIAQVLVAIKIIKSEGTLLGIAIIASLASPIAGAFFIADSMSEMSFLIVIGINFILTMAMYALYNKYFKLKNIEE